MSRDIEMTVEDDWSLHIADSPRERLLINFLKTIWHQAGCMFIGCLYDISHFNKLFMPVRVAFVYKSRHMLITSLRNSHREQYLSLGTQIDFTSQI